MVVVVVGLQVTIAYPDEGAWKRFHYQFKDEGYPEVICTKVRDGAKRIVRLKVSVRLIEKFTVNLGVRLAPAGQESGCRCSCNPIRCHTFGTRAVSCLSSSARKPGAC